MNAPIDLKGLERRAWVSYYQDGLWDIYLGLLLFAVGIMTTFLYGVEDIWLRYILYFVLIGGAWLFFQTGKRLITIPRLGRVRFGAERRSKKVHLGWIMAAFLLVNILLIFLTIATRQNPETWGPFMPQGLALKLFIGIFIGSAMALIAYYNDFTRGYYIALVFALTFAGTEVLDSPAVFWIGGALVLIPGLVLLARFLQEHPLPPSEVNHEHRGS